MKPRHQSSGFLAHLRSHLARPSIYRGVQRLIQGERAIPEFLELYVRPTEGMRLLDLGCGTADVLQYLPPVEYWGFDISEAYIQAARDKFPGRGRLEVADLGTLDATIFGNTRFDVIMAVGVIHHLPDENAQRLFQLAAKTLEPEGRLITLDGCYAPSQSKIARFLLTRDRGEFVRDQNGYTALAESSFDHVEPTLRHDLYRFPYSHLILCCSGAKPHG